MKYKKIIVTGSSGFIGRHLVDELLLQGHRVVGLDICANSSPKKRGYKFLKGKVELDQLKRIPFKPDWIFHCAGGGTVGFAEAEPQKDFQMNVGTSIEVLSFARTMNPSPRIVHLSSAAVYGDTGSKKMCENTVVQPCSSYGFHKTMSESAVRFYAQRWGIRSVIVRIFSVYGEGLTKQVFWDAGRKLRAGKNTFSGTGKETRDFIHIQDVCRFLVYSIKQTSVAPQTLNCGWGKAITIQTALTLLAKNLGTKRPRFSGKVRTGNPQHLVASHALAGKIGWRPTVVFHEGIRRYAEWVKHN
jgi:UDP-glucose 4-epimerase